MCVSESVMAGEAILIIAEDILSTSVALLLDKPVRRINLTDGYWLKCSELDSDFLTYVSKLKFVLSFWLAKFGPMLIIKTLLLYLCVCQAIITKS